MNGTAPSVFAGDTSPLTGRKAGPCRCPFSADAALLRGRAVEGAVTRAISTAQRKCPSPSMPFWSLTRSAPWPRPRVLEAQCGVHNRNSGSSITPGAWQAARPATSRGTSTSCRTVRRGRTSRVDLVWTRQGNRQRRASRAFFFSAQTGQPSIDPDRPVVTQPSKPIMSTLVIAVVLSTTRLHFAAATIPEAGWQPQWQRCVEVVVTKSSDPVQVVEQLCGADPSVILVSQPELRSMLLRRYTHDTVTLVDESTTGSSRASKHRQRPSFWWAYVPNAWEAATKQSWRVADMVYTYARRTHLTQLDAPLSGSGLFDRYKYVPAGAEQAEAREEKPKEGGVEAPR